jgi:SAM-dependent methyltransferase
MDGWPEHKKNRIFEVIKSLNLPETGDALDFGCGNGEFSGVLRCALPKWNIYGTDISAVAIKNARERHPGCSFFLSSDKGLENKRFDFLFSHHVLEHVENINKAWSEMNHYLKEKSSIFHVLPCGNQGSFEHYVCMLRKDGVDRGQENRFAFEDQSHLRRLTTKQMNDFAVQYNFVLIVDYYSNQFYGAINWITRERVSFVLGLTSLKQAKDIVSVVKLICLRGVLLLIKLMRFPAHLIDYKKDKMRKLRYYSLFLIFFIFYPLSKLINSCLDYMSDTEWRNKKCEDSGSEMFLYYKRM